MIDKSFALQAIAYNTDIAAIRSLLEHPANFHGDDGSGYEFWADQVIAVNGVNPKVAARLARSLGRWRKYAPALQEKMRSAS